jgi:hypothetical protein
MATETSALCRVDQPLPGTVRPCREDDGRSDGDIGVLSGRQGPPRGVQRCLRSRSFVERGLYLAGKRPLWISERELTDGAPRVVPMAVIGSRTGKADLTW